MEKNLVVVEVTGIAENDEQADKIKDCLRSCKRISALKAAEILISFTEKAYKNLENEVKVLCVISGNKWKQMEAVRDELQAKGFSVLAKAIVADYKTV